MAFVAEDGTGLSNSNGYILEAFLDAHHDDRGRDLSAYSTGQKTAAIVRATDYVDKRFGPKFKGYRQSQSQALEWPRIAAFDSDGYTFPDIPTQLQKAVAEYTWVALQLGELLPVPARPFSTIDLATGEVVASVAGAMTRKKDKVGPLEQDVSYSDSAGTTIVNKPGGASSSIVSDMSLPEYPVADEWIRELIESSMSGTLARA